jgi:hypothetical protein
MLPDESHDELELLPAEEEHRLGVALVAAHAPLGLTNAGHEAILQRTLFEVDSSPSEAEAAAAEELRRALETGDRTHPDAALAQALAAAVAGDGQPALRDPFAPPSARKRTAGGKVIRARFGAVVLGLAAAAGLVLLVQSRAERAPAGEQPLFATSRSLAPLVQDTELSTSARLDRIASVRARELRDNRYLAWGVP